MRKQSTGHKSKASPLPIGPSVRPTPATHRLLRARRSSMSGFTAAGGEAGDELRQAGTRCEIRVIRSLSPTLAPLATNVDHREMRCVQSGGGPKPSCLRHKGPETPSTSRSSRSRSSSEEGRPRRANATLRGGDPSPLARCRGRLWDGLLATS
jgi:hypothetical protein